MQNDSTKMRASDEIFDGVICANERTAHRRANPAACGDYHCRICAAGLGFSWFGMSRFGSGKENMTVIESLERRQLLSVVADQAHSATLQDEDGSTIAIRLAGAGTATADIVRGGFTLNLNKTDSAT